MKHVVVLLTNIIVTIVTFDPMVGTGESNGCSDQEHSPLCFCRSSYQHSVLTDLFIAKLSLSQCDNSLPNRYCHQSRFHPPSFHLIQLIPQLTDLSYCLKDTYCLHTLHSVEDCRQCHLSPSFPTHNDSYHSDACFYLCEHNTSCGFVCFNQPVIVSIHCNICQGRKQNISCRCIKTKPSCVQSFVETATPRWMQKRGFPAAGILGLLILAVIVLIIAIKRIYRQFDTLDRRQSTSLHYSILPIQSRQPSPTYLNQSQQLVIEIHQCSEENELSILLLEKTSKD